MIQKLIDQLIALQGRLRRSSSINVNDRATKAEAVGLATTYFNAHRPELLAVVGESAVLAEHDQNWQDLVRLAHGNNQRKTYMRVLGTLAKELKELSVLSLSRASERSREGQGLSILTPAENQIIATLETLLQTAAASYRQGIIDLRDTDRLSYRGTASEFREALRETLDHLAPDNAVAAQAGFKYENGLKRPTMKQKARYILISRGRSKTQRELTEKAVTVVESTTGDVVRATYDRASLATHLEATRAEVLRIKRYVDAVLFDLLEIAEVDEGRVTS